MTVNRRWRNGEIVIASRNGSPAAFGFPTDVHLGLAFYPKGVAYAWNASQQKVERMDFAERALPSRIYLNPAGMQLLFPNRGGETSASFALYLHDAVSDKTETTSTDTPPESAGPVIKAD